MGLSNTQLTATCSSNNLQRAVDTCRPSTNTMRPVANASGLQSTKITN